MASIGYLRYMKHFHEIIESFNPFKSQRLLHLLDEITYYEIM